MMQGSLRCGLDGHLALSRTPYHVILLLCEKTSKIAGNPAICWLGRSLVWMRLLKSEERGAFG